MTAGQELRIGRDDAPVEQQVCISGLNIESQHALVSANSDSIVLSLPTPHAKTFVNGVAVTSPVQLHHFDRVIFGNNHVFKVNWAVFCACRCCLLSLVSPPLGACSSHTNC